MANYTCNTLLFLITLICHGGIGEVVNTPDCGSGMRGFDPHISPHWEIYSSFLSLNKKLIFAWISFFISKIFLHNKGR